MNIILKAVKEALAANGGTIPGNPQTFRDVGPALTVASIQYDGAIGHTSFDANGDTTNTALTLYKVQNGAAVAVKALTRHSRGNEREQPT